MSERQEHKLRQTLQLEYIAAFSRWLAQEPPFWALIRRKRWKAARPVYRKDRTAVISSEPYAKYLEYGTAFTGSRYIDAIAEVEEARTRK